MKLNISTLMLRQRKLEGSTSVPISNVCCFAKELTER
jgi:hypothetical protein